MGDNDLLRLTSNGMLAQDVARSDQLVKNIPAESTALIRRSSITSVSSNDSAKSFKTASSVNFANSVQLTGVKDPKHDSSANGRYRVSWVDCQANHVDTPSTDSTSRALVIRSSSQSGHSGKRKVDFDEYSKGYQAGYHNGYLAGLRAGHDERNDSVTRSSQSNTLTYSSITKVGGHTPERSYSRNYNYNGTSAQTRERSRTVGPTQLHRYNSPYSPSPPLSISRPARAMTVSVSSSDRGPISRLPDPTATRHLNFSYPHPHPGVRTNAPSSNSSLATSTTLPVPTRYHQGTARRYIPVHPNAPSSSPFVGNGLVQQVPDLPKQSWRSGWTSKSKAPAAEEQDEQKWKPTRGLVALIPDQHPKAKGRWKPWGSSSWRNYEE